MRYVAKLPKRPARQKTKASLKMEDSQQKKYPPLGKYRITRPCIITDLHGAILAWYLPGILKEPRQVSKFTFSDYAKELGIQGKILEATEKLNPLLKKSQTDSGSGSSWHTDPRLFHRGMETHIEFGAVNISPAWFELGHEVSTSAHGILYLLIAYSGDCTRVSEGRQTSQIPRRIALARFHLGI